MALILSTSCFPMRFANFVALQSMPRLPWGFYGSFRTLYSAEAIGVDMYIKRRNRTLTQFREIEDKFRAKMSKLCSHESTSMIFPEDLKHMAHLVDRKQEDLTLLHQMMQKFNHQNKNEQFDNFILGPEVMRMYYHLNEPTHALATFNDPDLDGFFHQIISHQVLCNLLNNNEMHQQVLDVFSTTQAKPVSRIRFPPSCTNLVMASCYKLITNESYQYALAVLNEMIVKQIVPKSRTLCYAAALALQQNSPQAAYEILAVSESQDNVGVRNLKVISLMELSRIEDTLIILRNCIDDENPCSKIKGSVCSDVLNKLSAAVDNLGNKEISFQFNEIHEALVDAKQIAAQTLTEILDQEIEKQPGNNLQNRPLKGHGQRQGRQNFHQPSMDSNFRPGMAMSFRPNKNPAYSSKLRSLIPYEY